MRRCVPTLRRAVWRRNRVHADVRPIAARGIGSPGLARQGGVRAVVKNRIAVLVTAAVCGAGTTAACGGESPVGPSLNTVVTFAVQGETFRVALTSAAQVAAAHAAQSGGSARIPIGRIAPGTQVNVGWSWHLEDLTFAEAAIELCDGRPSDVERQGTQFAGGTFCPWSAVVVRIDQS
jgi:hypothetical protein